MKYTIALSNLKEMVDNRLPKTTQEVLENDSNEIWKNLILTMGLVEKVSMALEEADSIKMEMEKGIEKESVGLSEDKIEEVKRKYKAIAYMKANSLLNSTNDLE